jgi:hypothetical protein
MRRCYSYLRLKVTISIKENLENCVNLRIFGSGMEFQMTLNQSRLAVGSAVP